MSESRSSEEVCAISKRVEEVVKFPPSREELIELFKMKEALERLLETLGSTRTYFSRGEREKLVDALLIYGNVTDKNVNKDISQLRSTNGPIPSETRDQVYKKIKDLLELSKDELLSLTPQNDEERFALMVYDGSLVPKYRNELRTIGLIYCSVRRRMIVILGAKPLPSFESIVKSWGFEEPSKYFDYTGNRPIPEGRNE
jgi:hypothetical protein